MHQRLATELDRRFIRVPADLTRILGLAQGENAVTMRADCHRKAAINVHFATELLFVVTAYVSCGSGGAVVITLRISGERRDTDAFEPKSRTDEEKRIIRRQIISPYNIKGSAKERQQRRSILVRTSWTIQAGVDDISCGIKI